MWRLNMRTVKLSYFVCIIALMPLLGLSGCDFTVCPTFSVIAALINTYDLYVASRRWRCDTKAFDLVGKRRVLVPETSRGRVDAASGNSATPLHAVDTPALRPSRPLQSQVCTELHAGIVDRAPLQATTRTIIIIHECVFPM